MRSPRVQHLEGCRNWSCSLPSRPGLAIEQHQAFAQWGKCPDGKSQSGGGKNGAAKTLDPADINLVLTVASSGCRKAESALLRIIMCTQ